MAVLAILADLVLQTAPEVHVDEKPDPTGWFGKVVAFCFGAIFGSFLGLFIVAEVIRSGGSGLIRLVFVVCIIGCGLLAAKYGDDFWKGMSGD